MSPAAIQTRLLALGFDLGPTGADGVWGRRSISALKAFQARFNLTPNGVPSRATLALLFPSMRPLCRCPSGSRKPSG